MSTCKLLKRSDPIGLKSIVKNIGFLVKNIPFADKKAESHFNKTIEVASEIGANRIIGQAFLYLDFLHKVKKRSKQAKECISKAVEFFEKCGAEVYLKQAKEVLASLRLI